MPTIRLHALAALAVAALVATSPPPALAGTYTVHTCSTPTGTPTGMGGWTSSASVPVVGRDNGSATPCSSPGSSFTLQFGATGLPVTSGSWIAWSFTAPTGTSIDSWSFARAYNLGWPVVAGVSNRPYAYDAWHDDDENAGMLDFQTVLQSGHTLTEETPQAVDGSGSGWASLHIALRCFGLLGSLDCGPFAAQVAIPRATIGMTDPDAPVASVTGGSLTDADPIRGAANLLFHASDDGAGVYREIVSVDGDEVERQVVAGNGACDDAEPDNADDYEFDTPRPCPLEVSGEAQLDTSTLRDGAHVVRVSVEDAAGNVEVVDERTIATHNAPISTQPPAIAGAPHVGAQLTAGNGAWDGTPTAFGQRWLRCDADGSHCAGIAGAAGPTYTLGPDDAYHRILAEVTAENASGATAARSDFSAPIADAEGRTTPPPATSGGATQPGGAAGGQAPGGIGGLQNPLAAVTGHVANGDTPAGRPRVTLAFRLAGGGSAHRVRGPRARRWTLTGRVADGAGSGIANARLALAWKVAGRRWIAHGGVRTGADGRFAFVLPPGPSRAVRGVYYPFSDSRSFVSSNVVQEEALAPLTIEADPRRLGASRVVRLSGRVGGEGIPRGGLLVTLQGYQAGFGWRTFRTVRTTRAGAWSTRYRFRLARGRFAFRAIVPRQGSFPFATSQSAAVAVTVG
jgi:hypothetical protein